MKKNKEESSMKKDEVKTDKKANKTKIGLKFKHFLSGSFVLTKTTTLLIVAILLLAYISLNLWINKADLPEFDVTKNKIYSLSDASKEAISKVNQDVNVYVYGIAEDEATIKLLKQYHDVNDKINYEIITEESNKAMITEYGLQEGYYILIFKSGDSEKVIDASQDFTTYDNVSGQSVDTTEQSITNAVLSLCNENKPKVYFVQGHEEYTPSQMVVLTQYLGNEAFEYDSLEITTAGSIPEDCDVLAIMSPSTDYLDVEAQAIKDYIAKGGNLFVTMDVLSESANLTNFKSVIDEYGVSFDNGYIIETQADYYMKDQPFILKPQVNSTNDITKDIFTDSYMWLVYSGRLQFKSDEELTAMNVTKEVLLSSSDNESFFTNNLSASFADASQSATQGKSDIAALLTKKVSDDKESKLVMVASGSFISDYTVSALNNQYPLSYIGANKDFVINSMSYLGGKDNAMTIRKDYSSSTVYTADDSQKNIVKTIVFAVPTSIIILGCVVSMYRRRRK